VTGRFLVPRGPSLRPYPIHLIHQPIDPSTVLSPSISSVTSTPFLVFFSALMIETDAYRSQRERSRSPRRGRSRSPGRSGRRRSYSPRSRSRSRDEYRRNDRRSRSPMTGAGVGAASAGSAYGGAPQRSFEERAAAKEQMMSSLRESSQQDRRVYVGNLSYDVKWHHLKDFMRQG
jgi:hypothetical protein